MSLRCVAVLAMAPVFATAQSTCPSSLNFLSATTVNLKPSATSHIDVVRQSDGSYTGSEVTDAPPYRPLATIPHFEKQFAACVPHTIPASPHGAPPNANLVGAGSQLQVSMGLASGGWFVANISSDQLTLYFNIFDTGHNLVSQTAFTPPPATPPAPDISQSQPFYTLTLADVNGDGKLDLVAVFVSRILSSETGGVWVFLGNGDGTFQAGKSELLVFRGGLLPASSIAAGDLNGDGKADLVFGAPNQAPFTIALGNGDGTFNPQTLQVALPAAFFGGMVSAAIADLNGDGKADLVMSSNADLSSGTNVAVALGKGDGTFPSIVLYPVLNSYDGFPTAAVAVGDVNGDGIPDIVTSSGSILFGDGKGGFPTRKDYASSAIGSVMLADFDGDGITDIIVGNGNADFLSGTALLANQAATEISNPSMTVLFGKGGGAFVGAPVSAIGGGETLAAADFDGDGFPDLAMTTVGTAVTTILKGNGNGGFLPGVTLSTPGTVPLRVVTADFNRDGKPDLGVLVTVQSAPNQTGQHNQVQIYFGNGDGTFGAPLVFPVMDGLLPGYFAVPDLNNDGIPDLVLDVDGSFGSTFYVWLGKGDGTFSGPVFQQAASYPSLAFGDFNGDGKVDIAVANTLSTSVTVLLGKGDGTFPTSVSSMLPGRINGGPQAIAAADFTGDGKLDLAVALFDTPEIAVLTGQGDGTFGAIHTSPASANSIFAVDLNGDKFTDLVVVGPGPKGASALAGNGDGTFQPATTIVSLPLTVSAAIADFNRDGSPDVALTGTGFGTAAFLNLSTPPPALTVVSSATLAPGPLAPNSLATAFGEGLSAGAVVFISGPNTVISGVTLTVRDSAGISRQAQLGYVSDTQINFLVPADTAVGPATVTISTSNGKQLTAQIQIAPQALGLFAAYTVYVAPGGTQTIGAVGAPVDLSRPGQVYLVLLGTGFDAATAGSTTVTVQGVNAPVSYAGIQPTTAGLDQINALLPASLTGTGVATISVTTGGQTSNLLFVTIQ